MPSSQREGSVFAADLYSWATFDAVDIAKAMRASGVVRTTSERGRARVSEFVHRPRGRAARRTVSGSRFGSRDAKAIRLRLGVTYEKGVTLGNVTMSHRTRERGPPNALRLSPTQL
ncbi:hypothetical protein EVAR_85678_1 [Eumeta japonica]|uniref:Uncharacterized protein n=1 Tax=Eumeta variegata TaxID=151549 RepID=A0A4C1WAI8_EUMVA|nr:hypothetical protein EVAR_85678_1 [Eumeta japonica]